MPTSRWRIWIRTTATVLVWACTGFALNAALKPEWNRIHCVIKEEDKWVQPKRIRRVQNTEMGSSFDHYSLHFSAFWQHQITAHMHSGAEAHFSLSVGPEAQQQPRSGTHPGGNGTNAFWLIPLNSIVCSCEKKYSLFRIIVPSRHAIPNFRYAVPGTTQREKCLHLTRANRTQREILLCLFCKTCTMNYQYYEVLGTLHYYAQIRAIP